MSRIPCTVIGLLAATLLGSVSPLVAQDQSRERQLVQHLDTLVPLLRQARVEMERATAIRDSVLAAQPTAAQDTLRIGLAQVVTFPDQAKTAEALLGGVWAELGAMVQQSPAMERYTFGYSSSAAFRPLRLKEPARRIETPVWRPRSMAEENARESFGAVLAEDLEGTRVGTWVRGSVRAPQQPGMVYRELVATASKANRACVEGSPSACWTALDADLAEEFLEAWYTPAERLTRALQAGRGRYLYSVARIAFERCGSEGPGGDVSQCDAFLELVSRDLAAPLSNEARRGLLWVALKEGGEGSFDRLRADPAMSPADALQAASGLTAEELSLRWLAWVNDNRPTVYSGLDTTRWVAFFWFVFFGLLALRSTRWRSN